MSMSPSSESRRFLHKWNLYPLLEEDINLLLTELPQRPVYWMKKMLQFYHVFDHENSQLVTEGNVKEYLQHCSVSNISSFQIRKTYKLTSLIWRSLFEPALDSHNQACIAETRIPDEGVSPVQFLRHMTTPLRCPSERLKFRKSMKSIAEYMFIACDADHNEIVTFEEYSKFFSIFHISTEAAEASYSLLTDNGKRKLTRGRYEEAVLRFFASNEKDFGSLLFGEIL